MRPIASVLVACCLGAVCWGCAAGGHVEFVELNFKRIPDTTDLVEHIGLDRATWWIGEGDTIHVALDQGAPGSDRPGKGDRVDLSIVVTGLPAADSRDYPATRRTFRACRHVGTNHTRYASTHGIVALWFESGQVLRGRFRLVAIKELFHVLTGWTKVGQVVVVGDFIAKSDRGEGQKVLDRSEAGMKRKDAPNTPSDGRPKPVRVNTSLPG